MVQHTFKPEAGSAFVMMANLDGYVDIDSSGEIVAASCVLPEGITVTHPGTGLYLLTSNQAFNQIFPQVTFAANTAVALYPQVTLVTSTTVEVRLVNGSGAATDPSAGCGFSFHLRCKVSGVPN